jgi:hypothetical protein
MIISLISVQAPVLAPVLFFYEAKGVWSSPTSSPGRSNAALTIRNQVPRLKVYLSAGARRLRLLTRPFGEDYRKVQESSRRYPESEAASSKKVRFDASIKGKAPLVSTLNRDPNQATTPNRRGVLDAPAIIRSLRTDQMPAIRTSGAHQEQWKRIKQFERVWKEQGLSTDLDPVKLADRVVGLRRFGVNANTCGTLVRDIVHAKGDPQYEQSYHTRLQNLNYHYHRESSIMNNDSYLRDLDPQRKMQMLLEQTYKSADRQDKKRRKIISRASNGPISRKPEVNAGIEKVGNQIKKYLQEQNLDFYNMPLMELEEKTRNLDRIEGMTPILYSKNFYRYVQHRRGESVDDMNKLRRIRKKAIDKERKRLSRAQFRGQANER